MLEANVFGEWEEHLLPSMVEYRLNQTPSTRDRQMLALARTLSRYILVMTGAWLQDLVRLRYVSLDGDEICHVVDRAYARLRVDESHNRDREDLATSALRAFLVDHDELVLTGVQRFLLPAIRQEFVEALDHALDDWLMEKEHHEFVRLLHHFVSLHEPKMGTVHVFWQDLHFLLEDDHEQRVGEAVVRELSRGIPDDDPSIHDLLISALITMGPKRVVVHQKEEVDDILRTMHGVFENRVTCCRGCQRCKGLTGIQNPL